MSGVVYPDLTMYTTPPPSKLEPREDWQKPRHWLDCPHLVHAFKNRWMSPRGVLAVTISPPLCTRNEMINIQSKLESIIYPRESIWVLEYAKDDSHRAHFHGMVKCPKGQFGEIYEPDYLIGKMKQVCFVDAKYVRSTNSWISYITKDQMKKDSIINKYLTSFNVLSIGLKLDLEVFPDSGYDPDCCDSITIRGEQGRGSGFDQIRAGNPCGVGCPDLENF